MLFPQRFWGGLADGTVTMAFRRQKRPTVKAGGTLRSPGGVLAIDAVERIDPSDITDDDARAAGHAGRADVLGELRPEGDLYRIRFHRIGDDPRAELRQRGDLDDEEFEGLRRAVGRLAWARSALELIRDHPGVVSTDLAPQVGMDRLPFKQRVRRLKELGLTESLETGYQLSPRGAAFLMRWAKS